MKTPLIFTLTMTTQLLLSGQTAMAVVNQTYQEALERLDADAKKFFQAQNYVSVDPDTLTGDEFYSQKNFPLERLNSGSISLVDADLDPITRAMLLFETQEVELPHVRYRITYSMNTSTEVPEARQDYVEVTRYNLGPSRRNDLLASVPEGQLADPVEFGIGPNVSWRYVMAPIMGANSSLIYASRKEVTDAEAQTTDCLGASCLELIDPQGPDLGWKLISPSLTAPVYTTTSDLGLTRPARIVEELWANLSSEEMDILPYNQEQPQFEFVVSWNTSGQDVAASALAQQPQVMDDSIAEIWVRRFEMPQMPVEFAETYIYRH